MRRMTFVLPKYGWTVRVYLPVDATNAEEILRTLERSGISQTNLRNAYRHIVEDGLNCGLTYSNPRTRESVMAVGAATSAEECYDTLIHEQTHLAMHIAEKEGLDVREEEFAYLMGDIARMIFPMAEPYLCEHCRKHALTQ